MAGRPLSRIEHMSRKTASPTKRLQRFLRRWPHASQPGNWSGIWCDPFYCRRLHSHQYCGLIFLTGLWYHVPRTYLQMISIIVWASVFPYLQPTKPSFFLITYQFDIGICNKNLQTSNPQLPFKMPHIPTNRGYIGALGK